MIFLESPAGLLGDKEPADAVFAGFADTFPDQFAVTLIIVATFRNPALGLIEPDHGVAHTASVEDGARGFSQAYHHFANHEAVVIFDQPAHFDDDFAAIGQNVMDQLAHDITPIEQLPDIFELAGEPAHPLWIGSEVFRILDLGGPAFHGVAMSDVGDDLISYGLCGELMDIDGIVAEQGIDDEAGQCSAG